MTTAIPLATGIGVPSVALGYVNMEANELLTEYPDLDPADALKVAVPSGLIQAGMDKAQLFGAFQYAPNVRQLFTGHATKEMMKRMALQGGALAAGENIVEGAQDLTTPVIHQLVADLTQSLPDRDWVLENERFWKSRPDVALGMLPLLLLGVGGNTMANRADINALLSNNLELASAGFIESDRIPIMELAAEGRTEEAQALLQDAYSRRSPELAAQMGNEQAANVISAQKAVAAAEAAGKRGQCAAIDRINISMPCH
ncbi:hypothetical protein WJU23_14450 [Prosthecobacter sp. SYSU 5D2]|uniref:hypothetical protein n=1 Tax=Prosthecobacter sp. SYSU 5D2 TaxID=3134134 RepID=UPI0031FF1546